MTARRSLSASAGVVAALVVTAGALTLLPGAATPATAAPLVPWASCDDLLGHYRVELAKGAGQWGGIGLSSGEDTASVAAPVPVGAGLASAESGGLDAGTAGATGTNLQERDVDEPDLTKTVDGVLYTIGNDALHLLRTGPDPQPLSSYPLGQQGWGAELLVQDDRVLVLLPGHDGFGGGPAEIRSPWGGGYGGGGTTRALLLDVSDLEQPRLLEELVLDGRYLSARLSGGAVRLVTSSTPRFEPVQPAEPNGRAEIEAAQQATVEAAGRIGLEAVLPRVVRRNAAGMVLSDALAVDCAGVQHAPGAGGVSTLLVTTLDLTRGLAPRDSTAVTTDGELVYASADRLYVATSRWGTTAPAGPAGSRAEPETGTVDVERTVTTELHGFDTRSPSRTTYVGSGSVPGYVLGRWALSSHDGHLRVATTTGEPWGPVPSSESRVTVLAENADGLEPTGSVGGLGRGERIQSVRYFGDLATVVTFRQTDPLYTLDLSDPTEPRLLGELKIPGFSTYLHPVGDGLLLGVGHDADLQGRTTGVQVSLFDLSDLGEPRRVDALVLGEGWSPVDGDSRAFGWDERRRTALLPFTHWTGTGEDSRAVGVRVTDDRRLVEVGRLRVPTSPGVERVLHDDEHVYAISRGGVVAADADTFAETGRQIPTGE